MESNIAVNMKSFLFSKNLISDHQFGFRPGHSTFEMLLPLTQQWMEVLNVRHEIRPIFLDMSLAFDTVQNPALFSKLVSCGIEDQLITWLIDFLYWSQHVALNRILSSTLPGMA